MALPFFDRSEEKRDQCSQLDLGGRVTKAVHVQRRGDGYVLNKYAIMDAPIFDKTIPLDLLTDT